MGIEATLLRLSAPCAAKGFDRRVPFSQVACAVWRGNRLPRLCFRIRHPSEVSACAMMLALRHRETGGTVALLPPVPSFRASRRREPYGRFRPERYSNAAVQNVL